MKAEGREVGITVLRILGTTVGKVVPWGNSLGQEFEQGVMDAPTQGLERSEGWEGGRGEVLALGALGCSEEVCWVSKERHSMESTCWS